MGAFNPVLVAAGARAFVFYGADSQDVCFSICVVGRQHCLSATPVLVPEAVESGFY